MSRLSEGQPRKSSWIGKFLGRAILQSQSFSKEILGKEAETNLAAVKTQYGRFVDCERSSIGGLDTVTLKTKDCDANSPYVIHFGGNRETWQSSISNTANFLYTHKKNEKHVSILFNPPGVGKSAGSVSSQEDLVDAGLKQVNVLLENGVKPEQIILKGYSLGGAVATLVAAKLKDEGKDVYLFNDRSFSSLKNVVKSWVQKLHLPISTNFVKGVLTRFEWKMDVQDSWNKIDQDKKSLLYADNDSIITDKGGLYRKIEKDPSTTDRDSVALIRPVSGNDKENHEAKLNHMQDLSEKRGETIFLEVIRKVAANIVTTISLMDEGRRSESEIAASSMQENFTSKAKEPLHVAERSAIPKTPAQKLGQTI